MKTNNSIKLIVCDMAGTTVNEGGIVYKMLYKTIKDNGIQINEGDIDNFHGVNKTEVLNHFIKNDPNFNNSNILPELLKNFKNNLRNSYFNNDNISLIHEKLPELFNNYRKMVLKLH